MSIRHIYLIDPFTNQSIKLRTVGEQEKAYRKGVTNPEKRQEFYDDVASRKTALTKALKDYFVHANVLDQESLQKEINTKCKYAFSQFVDQLHSNYPKKRYAELVLMSISQVEGYFMNSYSPLRKDLWMIASSRLIK